MKGGSREVSKEKRRKGGHFAIASVALWFNDPLPQSCGLIPWILFYKI